MHNITDIDHIKTFQTSYFVLFFFKNTLFMEKIPPKNIDALPLYICHNFLLLTHYKSYTSVMQVKYFQ